jgi:hypothetical protein
MHFGLILSCSTFATAASLWSSKSASWDLPNEGFLIGNGKLGGRLVHKPLVFDHDGMLTGSHCSNAFWGGGNGEDQSQLRRSLDWRAISG